MRCVIDTNVWVSALLSPTSTPRKALDRVIGDGKTLLSLPVLAELNDVVSRRRIRRYVEGRDIQGFLDLFIGEASCVEATTETAVCRDPEDDKFLSLAASGAATHIVTGDQDLLALDPFRGIRILAPQDFLALP